MITHFHHKTVAMTEEEINSSVVSIIGSLGSSQRDFQHASEMYNSDFFRDEPLEFKVSLCNALLVHFKGHQNHYWTKNSKG